MALSHRLGIDSDVIGTWSAEKFSKHLAYLRDYDPELRRDQQIALLTAVTANSGFGGGDKQSDDFLFPPQLQWGPEPKEEAPDPMAIIGMLQGWVAASGGLVME